MRIELTDFEGNNILDESGGLSDYEGREGQRHGWPSYRLVSLWDMLRFHFDQFYALTQAMARTHLAKSDFPLTQERAGKVISLLNGAREACKSMGLRHSLRQIENLQNSVRTKPTDAQIATEFEDVQKWIHSELSGTLFMFIPGETAEYYEKRNLFGDQVPNKFDKTLHDIEEAGKCIATARYTAAVFHLMRIMELAVQYLGKRLKIALVDEKNWQNILDEINKAIKALPAKTAKQKAKRGLYSEAAAHLYNVKEAWRNRVMHPKETYTEEEAEDVFLHVKAFMRHLATKL